MRSKELASLAGVTVRALRHYHQVRVLPEPRRSANGYREYTVHDLIRVLRVKRLAAIGIPLDKMGGILDSTGQSQNDLLIDLDRELDAQITRLTSQKALLGMILEQETSPDVPPEFARFTRMFALAGHSEAINQLDREQAVLLAHLLDDAGISHLVALHERATAPDLVDVISDLTTRLDHLGADTSPAEIDRLVDDFVERLGMIIHEFSHAPGGIDLIDEEASNLFNQHMYDALNPEQKIVITRAVKLLEAQTVQETGEDERE